MTKPWWFGRKLAVLIAFALCLVPPTIFVLKHLIGPTEFTALVLALMGGVYGYLRAQGDEDAAQKGKPTTIAAGHDVVSTMTTTTSGTSSPPPATPRAPP